MLIFKRGQEKNVKLVEFRNNAEYSSTSKNYKLKSGQNKFTPYIYLNIVFE